MRMSKLRELEGLPAGHEAALWARPSGFARLSRPVAVAAPASGTPSASVEVLVGFALRERSQSMAAVPHFSVMELHTSKL